MNKIKAVYYARVSTEEEKQLNALENQCKDLEDYIKSQDFKLVDKYIDEGKSGTTTKKRDEYNRLFNDMHTDKFDIIIIKSQDRLMRKTMDWYIFINELVTNNKKLYIYMENSFYKTDDALITGIKAMLSEDYSRELSKKLNRAHKRREQEGSSVMTNGTMIGYDQVNGELVINKEEAEIVQKVYDLYVNQGYGLSKISVVLKDEGYTNRNGKHYTTSTLGRMLQNEKYKGTMVCNKYHKVFDTKSTVKNDKSEWIIHENRIPVIIEKELWEQAQEIRNSRVNKENDRRKGKRVTKHILAYKLICGECGQVFWFNTVVNRFNNTKYRWFCSSFSRYGRLGIGMRKDMGCNMPNISDEKIENLLIEILSDFNSNKEETINEYIELIDELLENHSDTEIRKLEENISSITNKRNVLLDKFLDGTIKEDIYKTKSIQLENELNEKQKELDKLITSEKFSSSEKVIRTRDSLNEYRYKNMTYKSFVAFIDKIIVYHDYINLYIFGLNNPIEIKCNLFYR